MATRGMLWGRFEVTLEGSRLHGRAWGEKVNSDKHRPAVEVKGATYTQLRVKKNKNPKGKLTLIRPPDVKGQKSPTGEIYFGFGDEVSAAYMARWKIRS